MLSELWPDCLPEQDVSIQGLTDDSRRLVAGDLFLAAKGINFDARDLIPKLAETGAAAICCDAPYTSPVAIKIPLLQVAELPQQKGHIASRFYGNPSAALKLIAITGTNGKTSCSQFVAEGLSLLGQSCAMVGTMGYGLVSPGKPIALKATGLTTPDALSLQSILSDLLQDDADAVCLEASSHGLAQGRLNGCDIDVAVFTNITRDHLDYHPSFADYKQAKAKLFTWPGLGLAVLNFDDKFSLELAEMISPDTKLLRYSLNDTTAEIHCRQVDYHEHGIRAEVQTPWGVIHLDVPILGDFNLSNLLAAIAVFGGLKYTDQQIEDCLSRLKGVRGRMEVMRYEYGPTVVVDYAHTPDALEKAIQAVRLHNTSPIWTVMGCGGDRDKGKRPLMGEIAARLSEQVIVTDDNPRFEASELIIEDILAGINARKNVTVIAERKSAIAYAIDQAEPGDLVLIAGKGHEQYQDIAGERKPYSDHHEIELALKRRSQLIAASNARAPNSIAPSSRAKVIVGFGKTGLACARYFERLGITYSVADDAISPTYLDILKNELPNIRIQTISDESLGGAEEIIVSPGVPLSLAPLRRALGKGITITGDVAMFASLRVQPLIAITGSNGKTTVTDLLGFMLREAGRNPGVGGNIGTPCLELLEGGFDSYVIEMSSYQLELVEDLQADIAVVLNLAPDHLDRYKDLDDYYQTKFKIYRGCGLAIINRDLGRSAPRKKIQSQIETSISFGTDEPTGKENFGIRVDGGETYLAMGEKNLMATSELRLVGRHNWQNALAALAIGSGLDLQMDVMLSALRSYPGLAHRCEWLGKFADIDVYNDSKSTNPASTLAAINGLAEKGRDMYLILGGEAKQADFSVLSGACESQSKAVYIFGRDRLQIEAQLGERLEDKLFCFETLVDVIEALKSKLNAGDQLLFSPACASFDQFDNYQHRGETFGALVAERLI